MAFRARDFLAACGGEQRPAASIHLADSAVALTLPGGSNHV